MLQWVGFVVSCLSALMLVGVLIVGLSVTAFARPVRRRTVVALLAGVVICALTCVAGLEVPNLVASVTRVRDLEHLDRNARPLVAAIRAYEADHPLPPMKLEDLVPEYLAKVPSTGLWQWPTFTYYERRGGHWDLLVLQSSYAFDLYGSRAFLYEPDRSRDACTGLTLRRGDWVYVP
jgi:hypothetical protein